MLAGEWRRVVTIASVAERFFSALVAARSSKSGAIRARPARGGSVVSATRAERATQAGTRSALEVSWKPDVLITKRILQQNSLAQQKEPQAEMCVCVWRENSSAVHGGNRCESTGVCRRGFVSRILTHTPPKHRESFASCAWLFSSFLPPERVSFFGLSLLSLRRSGRGVLIFKLFLI